MIFTFPNVWENRDAFIEVCRYAGACKTQFKRLIEAKTKNEFMQVVYDNFNWINESIKNFKPKVDKVYSWDKGIALVKLKGKYGFINNNGSYLIEPKFDDAYSFYEGFALVKSNGKWGFIKKDGSYLVEPIFERAGSFSGSLARVKLDGKHYNLDTDGNLKEIK